MVRFGRSRPKVVVPLADQGVAAGRRDTQVGSLARALAQAGRCGVAIPETFVVTADLFRHVVHTALPPGHDPASLVRIVRRPIGVERAARARERLLSASLDSDVERELDAAFADLRESAPWGIAVRASPILADHGLSRAAGLSYTELPVTTRDELGLAVRRAWALAASEVTLEYLRARKIRDLAVAVALQPVVAARASLTLVTDAHALDDPDGVPAPEGPRRVAMARAGLSNSGVDLAEADVVAFDRDGAAVERRFPAQNTQFVVREGALRTEPASGARPILSSDDVAALAAVARRLEPMGPSVSRCVLPFEGELVLVDTAPLEHEGHPGTGTALTLWVRAAVDEAPPGPLTPLSSHLMRQPMLSRGRLAYGDRSRRQGRLSGILAGIDGRPYLNVTPLLEHHADKDPVDVIGRVELGAGQWVESLGREPSFRPSLARAGLRIAQIASEQKALTDDVGRFERDAEQQRRWLAELDLGILPDDALTTTLHEVALFLSRAYQLHARGCALSVTGHGLLASVLSGAEAGRAAWLSHAVSAGAGVVTARPAAAFCHVAAIARFDAPALSMLEHGSVASVGALPEGPLSRAFRQFLEAYGDRGLSEVELESARFREDARPVFEMLRAVLRGSPVDPDIAASRARALADRALALLEPKLSFFETRVVRDVVSRQRELLRLRERCRARIAHGLSMMRVVMLDVDRRIGRLDPTLDGGAALFLTLKELGLALAKYRADLAPIVRSRRADLAAQAATREPVPVFRGAPKPSVLREPFRVLGGLSLAGGSGEGRVVRLSPALEGLSRFVPGDVLCVRTLDLGFAPLFSHAAAVVTELGTPFSAGAVVARDFGVPVVGAVSAALGRLRDGDRVHVDGDAGTVEIEGP